MKAMRTNNLRKSIIATLQGLDALDELGIKQIYFDEADERAVYPHLVVSFPSVDLSDFFRRDFVTDIDVYNKIIDPAVDRLRTFDICDLIEDVFNNFNKPNDEILPTFFLTTRQEVEDQDKSIQHIVIRLQTQLYENK